MLHEWLHDMLHVFTWLLPHSVHADYMICHRIFTSCITWFFTWYYIQLHVCYMSDYMAGYTNNYMTLQDLLHGFFTCDFTWYYMILHVYCIGYTDFTCAVTWLVTWLITWHITAYYMIFYMELHGITWPCFRGKLQEGCRKNAAGQMPGHLSVCVLHVWSFHPSYKQSLHSIMSSVFLTELEFPPCASHKDSTQNQAFRRAPGRRATADQLEVDLHGVKRCDPVPRPGKK